MGQSKSCYKMLFIKNDRNEVYWVCNGKVLVARGATGAASVRSCWRSPPCPIELMPASSKMHPLLAKAEPISDGGSASVITYLRRGKRCCATPTAARRELRRCERNSSAGTKVSEEGGGGGGAPGTEQRCHGCSLWRRPW